MKLSIIIPIYNVKDYIIECLDSVYNGNLTDFEVICIDDRGTDDSIKITKKYIKDNKIDNLRIIKHQKNRGLSAARNTGIKAAKGEYICLLDSDDMIDASELNKLINYAKTKKLDILEASYSEIFETDMNIKVGTKIRKNKTEILNGDEYFYESTLDGTFVPMAWCKLYRKEYLLKNKYEFKEGLKFEDEEFSPRVIIGAKKIQYIDKEFYIYRRRDNSITTNMVKDNKWVNHYLQIIDSLTNFSETIKDKKSYDNLKNRISEIALSLYKNPIAYGSKKEDLKEIIKIVKEKKIYNIPITSKNKSIKMQGILMKYPKLFKFIYTKRLKAK